MMSYFSCYRCRKELTGLGKKYIVIKLPEGDRYVCMDCYLVNFLRKEPKI